MENTEELVRAIHPQQAHIGDEYLALISHCERKFSRWGKTSTGQPVVIDAMGQFHFLQDYFKAGVSHAITLDMWEDGSAELCKRCDSGDVYMQVRRGIEGPQPNGCEMEPEVRKQMLETWHKMYNDIIVTKRREVDEVLKKYADHRVPRKNLKVAGA